MTISLPLLALLIIAPVFVVIAFASGYWYLGTSIFAVVASLNIFLIYRNEQVYQLKKQILNDFGVNALKLLPDYDLMVNSFWIPVGRYKRDILLKAGIMAGG